MLIRNAEIEFGRHHVDVRIAEGRIVALAAAGTLAAVPNAPVLDARGGALFPGLHDHHLHLRGAAAAMASVSCGPPQVQDAAQLAQALRAAHAALAPGAWLRGVGYHESVAGEIDRVWLDAVLPDRPLRIQHRSGRLWILNSCALQQVETADAPLERVDGVASGRLYDADAWLREQTRSQPVGLHALSLRLAQRGVTGVTDTSHHNGLDELAGFAAACARGELRQRLRMMGDARLDGAEALPGVQCGEHKFHLHEHALPLFDELCAAIRRSHECGRATAFHCVSRTDLVYALAALREAGVLAGDRIEHAAVMPPELLQELCALGLVVVTQPNFIRERGDSYLRDVAADDQPWLYRLRGVLDAGAALAGSTDAPYGDPDPWLAMQAAVTRTTVAGSVVGAGEALTPEQAVALFLDAAASPGRGQRRVAVGADADLCLLTQPWAQLRPDLAAAQVRLTLCRGEVIWQQG